MYLCAFAASFIVVTGLFVYTYATNKKLMRANRYKLKWLSRLMLGMMLFMQGVVTAYACPTPAAGAAQAFTLRAFAEQSLASSQAAQTPSPPCHQKNTFSDNANACLEHCTQFDHVSGAQVLPLILPAALASTLVLIDDVERTQPMLYPEYIQLSSGPPLSIRFCSFLI